MKWINPNLSKPEENHWKTEIGSPLCNSCRCKNTALCGARQARTTIYSVLLSLGASLRPIAPFVLCKTEIGAWTAHLRPHSSLRLCLKPTVYKAQNRCKTQPCLWELWKFTRTHARSSGPSDWPGEKVVSRAALMSASGPSGNMTPICLRREGRQARCGSIIPAVQEGVYMKDSVRCLPGENHFCVDTKVNALFGARELRTAARTA